MSKAFYCYRRK